MQRVLSVRGARFLSLWGLILTLLLGGCTADLLYSKFEVAEENLSMGKPMGEQLKKVKPDLAPPSVESRYKIALAVDSALSEKYDENEVVEMRKSLAKIRKDPLVPHYLKIEAGYVLELLEKIEGVKQQGRAASQQKEKVAEENDRMKKELEEMKKELQELKYKLEKIEEIHINTEKKRGVQ